MRSDYLYAFKNELTGFIKIGISNNPEKRKRSLEYACGCPLTVVFTIKTLESAEKVEREVHLKLKEHRQLGEWFNCSEAAVIAATNNIEIKTRYKRTPHLMKKSSYHLALRKRLSKGHRSSKG